MTNFEMTKLCAEAITHGNFSDYGYIDNDRVYFGIRGEPGGCLYDPLRIDGQAMELMKKFKLSVLFAGGDDWQACHLQTEDGNAPTVFGLGVNDAIVRCVAKVQFDRKAKEAAAIGTAS